MIIETLTQFSVYLWTFSLVGFAFAYLVVVGKLLAKPVRTLATFVASFFM
jgi:hypothetical protein